MFSSEIQRLVFSSEMGGDTNHKKPTASVCSLVKCVGDCDTNHKKPTASVCSLVKWG